MMLDHQTEFGHKRLSCSEDTFQTQLGHTDRRTERFQNTLLCYKGNNKHADRQTDRQTDTKPLPEAGMLMTGWDVATETAGDDVSTYWRVVIPLRIGSGVPRCSCCSRRGRCGWCWWRSSSMSWSLWEGCVAKVEVVVVVGLALLPWGSSAPIPITVPAWHEEPTWRRHTFVLTSINAIWQV